MAGLALHRSMVHPQDAVLLAPASDSAPVSPSRSRWLLSALDLTSPSSPSIAHRDTESDLSPDPIETEEPAGSNSSNIVSASAFPFSPPGSRPSTPGFSTDSSPHSSTSSFSSSSSGFPSAGSAPLTTDAQQRRDSTFDFS